MKRSTVGLLTVVTMAVSIMLTVFPAVQHLMRWTQAERAVSAYMLTTEDWGSGREAGQRNLAKWYNFCLRMNLSQEECREAYGSILHTAPGVMGYLEFPEWHFRLPLFHSGSVLPGCYSAEHLEGSAFPVGGRGNHTILTIPEVFSGFREGDVFVVHILDQRISYRVENLQFVAPGRTEGILPSRNEDRCTLITTVCRGSKQRKLLIRGIREADGESPPAALEKTNLLLCLLQGMPVLLLPAAAGGIGKAANGLWRKWNCGTSTNRAR